MDILMFPGQGSQKIGMGKTFYDNFTSAKYVFEEVDQSLNFNLSNLIFSGDIKELSLTFNTQPALMAVSIAIFRVFQEEFGDNKLKYVCGHSLGEFTALCAANVISLSETARLLRIRGKAMQEAVPEGEGSMAALISPDFSQLENLLLFVKNLGVCEIANDNSNDQIVVSGSANAIKELVKNATSFSIKRAIILNVSAPFHCSLMMPAQIALENALKDIKFKEPDIPVICNYSATSENQSDKLKYNIINQVTNKVRWRETMEFVKSKGVQRVIECGSGKVLSGLFKRFSNSFEIHNIEMMEDLLSFKDLN